MATSSGSTTLVKKKDKELDLTVGDIRDMHERMKGWYTYRDILIRQFIRMADLQSPFGLDKDGMQDGGVITATGDVEFDIATFPFDIISLAMSSMDNLHPIAYCLPRGDQTDEMAHKFEMMMNAVLDQRMQQSNFNKPLIQKLAATGWACIFHPFDQELGERGEFPFDIQVMNILGVYPHLDVRGNPLWVSYERRVTGAQLKDAYGEYPGVAELFEDEPDAKDSKYNRYNKTSILTETFRVIRFYNDKVTCLLLDSSYCSYKSIERNPTLKKYHQRSKEGKHQSVLVGSKYEDASAGVLEHHLGKVPFSFGWCWPELRDATSGNVDDDSYAGRYYGLPFLYSQFNNWRNISRILSAFHSAMIRWTNRPYVTDSDVTDLNTSILKLNSGEGIKPLEIPTMPPEGLKLLEQLQMEVDRSSFAPSSYGAQAGTSGAQQDQNYQAGSIRMDTLRVESERVTAKALYAIGCGMIEQGDDKYSLYGNGTKYDGPYKIEYSVKGLKYPPAINVKLKANTAFVNAEDVLKFKTLTDLLPQKKLYEELLNIPNPEKVMEELRQELVMKNDQNMAPYVQLGALTEQNKLFEQTTNEAWKLQENQDKAKLWVAKKQADLDESQVDEENMVTQIQANIQQRTTPPSPPSMPPNGTPPPLPPGQMVTGGSPNIPPGMSAPISSPPMGPGMSGPPPNLRMPGNSLPPSMNSSQSMGMPPTSSSQTPMPAPGGLINTGMGQPSIPLRPPMPMPPPQMMRGPLPPTGAGIPPVGQHVNMAGVQVPSVMGHLQRKPDDRGQPMQNMRREAGPGLGNTGLNTRILGPNAQPGGLSPALQEANRKLTPQSLQTQVMGTQKSRKPRRARGGK